MNSFNRTSVVRKCSGCGNRGLNKLITGWITSTEQKPFSFPWSLFALLCLLATTDVRWLFRYDDRSLMNQLNWEMSLPLQIERSTKPIECLQDVTNLRTKGASLIVASSSGRSICVVNASCRPQFCQWSCHVSNVNWSHSCPQH